MTLTAVTPAQSFQRTLTSVTPSHKMAAFINQQCCLLFFPWPCGVHHLTCFSETVALNNQPTMAPQQSAQRT